MPTLGLPTMASLGNSLFLIRLVLGKQGDDDVEEIADAEAVDGGDRVRLALTQRVEPVALGVVRGVVQLVDGEHGPALRPPELAGDGAVGLRRPEAGVDEMNHNVGLLDRDPRLQRHECLEADPGHRLHPAGVDQGELPAGPLGPVVGPVARGAWLLGDHGAAAAHDPVDERALSDVRRPDDGDDGKPPQSDPDFGSCCSGRE